MKLTLDTTKTVEQNAGIYFDAAKKAKRKIEGARKALDISNAKLEKLQKQGMKIESKVRDKEEKEKEHEARKVASKQKEQWFHKFRWFFSSEGFLVIGGRDATTNEIVIKKHLDSKDLVFHTEMSGSPFFVIKADSNPDKKEKIGKATIDETAQATASYSKAWKLGVGSAEVFYVKPEQVSKEAKAGEYIAKGSFMIYGDRTFIKPDLELAIANTNDGIMAGPPSAIKKHAASKVIIIKQGSGKTSDTAKEIRKIIGGELDDIIKVLPQGVRISKS